MELSANALTQVIVKRNGSPRHGAKVLLEAVFVGIGGDKNYLQFTWMSRLCSIVEIRKNWRESTAWRALKISQQ